MIDFRDDIAKTLAGGPTINTVHSNAPLGTGRKKKKVSVAFVNKAWATRMILKSSSQGIEKFSKAKKQHPVAQAFLELHKTYEPQVAAAFKKVCDRVKSGLDMKALTDEIESKNIHAITQMVVGDNFEKGLGGEFKQILFEAYHAGGLMGAKQLKNAPVRKGGPGSGRYPAGSGQTKTPEFKNWFGNSKIVDNQGNPKVLYHGTFRDFNEFNSDLANQEHGGHFGEYYFSDNPRIAQTYSGYVREVIPASAMHDREIMEDAVHGANVMPVHLKMENPLIINRAKGTSTLLTEDQKYEATTKAIHAGHDGVIFKDVKDSVGQVSEAKRGDVYVVFKPTQIKSAIGNNTFDVKNPDITKGGPGSGPQTHNALYRDILSRQRTAEGMRVPALRHWQTGEVFPARFGEIEHSDIMNRLQGDGSDFEQGFMGRHGNFIPRNRIEGDFGRAASLVGKAFVNQDAVDYLASELPTLISQINEQQAKAVQQILLDGINGGSDGPDIARRIRDVVGLTDAQAQWVENFRQQLEDKEEGDFTPISERRLSVVDANMAQDEMEAVVTNPGVVDLLVGNYAASLLNKRAMDISVTECHNAFIQGQSDLWDQATNLGYLNPDITRRHWLAVGDDRTRDDHMDAMNNNEPDGVGMDEPFDTPFGDVMNPGDSGDDSEDINCRCTVYLTFNDEFGAGIKGEDEEDEDADTE